MATARTIVNSVLRILGEDEIPDATTTLTDKYQILVLAFVDQIKSEVEDATNWRSLRQRREAQVLANSYAGLMLSSTIRARLIREHDPLRGVERPLVFDLTDTDKPSSPREVDLATQLINENVTPPDITTTIPSQFAIDSVSAFGNLGIRVFPKPDNTRLYVVYLTEPQPPLAIDDLDTDIFVPELPVRLGALWYALEERGEELGVNGIFTEEKYRKSLDDAISKDDAESGGLNLVPV